MQKQLFKLQLERWLGWVTAGRSDTWLAVHLQVKPSVSSHTYSTYLQESYWVPGKLKMLEEKSYNNPLQCPGGSPKEAAFFQKHRWACPDGIYKIELLNIVRERPLTTVIKKLLELKSASLLLINSIIREQWVIHCKHKKRLIIIVISSNANL